MIVDLLCAIFHRSAHFFILTVGDGEVEGHCRKCGRTWKEPS